MHESISEYNQTEDLYVDYITHSFLDENQLLLSCCDYADGVGFRNGRVVVLDLTRGNDAFLNTTSFLVPAAAENCALADIVVAHFSPSAPCSGTTLFQASRKTSVVAIRCIYQQTALGSTENILFLIPSATLSYLCTTYDTDKTSEPITVDWDSWGPQHTRALDHMDLSNFVIFGSRFLCIQDHYVTIYDFNYRAALSPITRSLANCVNDHNNPQAISLATCFTSPSTIRSEMLKEELTTSLPYRVLSTGITDEKGTEIVLSEDSISIHDVRNATCFRSILSLKKFYTGG